MKILFLLLLSIVGMYLSLYFEIYWLLYTCIGVALIVVLVKIYGEDIPNNHNNEKKLEMDELQREVSEKIKSGELEATFTPPKTVEIVVYSAITGNNGIFGVVFAVIDIIDVLIMKLTGQNLSLQKERMRRPKFKKDDRFKR